MPNYALTVPEARAVLIKRSADLATRLNESYDLGQNAMVIELRAIATTLNQLANLIANADPAAFPG